MALKTCCAQLASYLFKGKTLYLMVRIVIPSLVSSHSFLQGVKEMKQEVHHNEKPLTLQASLSTKATMEFLNRVAAVKGRLVTSVMLI